MSKIEVTSKLKLQEVDLEDLAEDVSTLTDMGLNRQQALSTLALFPGLEQAMKVASSYRTIPVDERPISFTSYNSYLEALKDAVLGPDEVIPLYDQEVEARTVLVPIEALQKAAHRDKPHRGKHYDEHALTRGLDTAPEVAPEDVQHYLGRYRE